jgi:hypothetical protein
MRNKLLGLVGLLVLAACGTQAIAGDSATHVLYVDGTPYNSYQESGPVIHWETGPIDGGEDVTFPERDQVWEGNGSDNLPCEFGAHWVSNDNLLTLSHCLDGPDESTTTTSTTVPDETTTTTVPASTTTVPASTTTVPASTTTVPASTTTVPASTTTVSRGTTPTVNPQAAPTTAAPTALPETL